MRLNSTRFIQISLIVLFLFLAAWQFFKLVGPRGGGCDFTEREPVDELVYVDHARCRMACRDVGQALVEDVYLHGELNCDKSDPAGTRHKGHPRYALELKDGNRGRVRVIVEDEGDTHVIVTVIRLDEEDRCTCS